MQEDRELDAAVAEHVLGMHVERVTPYWLGYEVRLFFRPGEPLVVCSLAEHGDPMMYRNGEDDRDGVAAELPDYSTDLLLAWTLVRPYIKDFSALEGITSLDPEAAARLICVVAVSQARLQTQQLEALSERRLTGFSAIMPGGSARISIQLPEWVQRRVAVLRRL